MILAIRYTVKGVKKGYKKYKAHQDAKEEAARVDMPDVHDPSRELDATCQAERARANSSESSRSSTTACDDTLEAEKALENDPEFQKYMMRHRNLYLAQHNTCPPAYDSVMTNNTSPATLTQSGTSTVTAMSDAGHCTCHNCSPISRELSGSLSSQQCGQAIPEMPASTITPTELDVSSPATKSLNPHNADDEVVVFEVMGDLPAVESEPKTQPPSELPSTTVSPAV